MSIDIALHNVSKVSAEVEHGESAHWVELHFSFSVRTGWSPPSSGITVFFNDARTADAFASAVNSVNRPHVVVARNTTELMQQLRDCPENAERVP